MIPPRPHDDAERTRKIYEQRPYPAEDGKALSGAKWRLAPMAWINAHWKPGRENTAPRRILVAGCGAGSEAFAMQRKFPRAEIVAVDFSPRSIAIARDLQRRDRKMRRIKFVVGDLAAPSLARKTGRGFDFASCHGVLSYIPAPAAALKNHAHCLGPDGALCLGVNGAQHSSVTLREFLPAFGYDPSELRDGPHLRKTLALADDLLGLTGRDRISRRTAGYLAGDAFGPLIQNLPLADWLRFAEDAGLVFHGSYHPWRRLRTAMAGPSGATLLPRSRPEVCQLVETLCPESFHRMIFTRRPVINPPWEKHDALLRWVPVLTSVYNSALPRRSRSWAALRNVTFKSREIDTRLDWQMPEWELEILRECKAGRSLGEIIRRIPHAISPQLLREQLYALHHLLIINLLPPKNNTSIKMDGQNGRQYHRPPSR